MLIKRSTLNCKLEEGGIAKLGQCKNTKNKRFIVIELIKDHVFGLKDYITYEFVVFRTEEMRLNQTKTIISVEKSAIHDFEISDEVRSIDFPYLYFLCGT